MANSGSFNTSGYSGRYLTFAWSVKSQDVANNRTTINWSLKGAGGSTYDWYMSGNFKVLINGQQVYFSSNRIQLYNGTTVASGTFTINHNNDGTASFGAYAEAGIYYVAVNCSGNGSWSLPTIPRASQPSINTYPNNSPDFNIGDKITIHMNRAASIFTHTVKINYGSTSYTIATGVTNSCTFDTSKIADALYALIPNANVYNNTISVTTYNGSTNIGTKTCPYKAHVINANPTFNAAYLDSNAATTAVTQNDQIIVRNKSALTFNIANATALKSATLKNVMITAANLSKTVTLSSSSATVSLGALNSSQDVQATVKVTDSRGNSTTKTVNITVADWQAPSAIITAKRHDNYYSETDINVDADYSSVDGKNTITIQARTQKQGETTWSAYQTLEDNVTTVFDLDNEYAWNIQVLLTDSFGGSTTYNAVLSRGMPIVYFDRIKSSTGFNCFPQYDQSVEVSGRLFVQNQDILDKFTGIGGTAQAASTSDWNTAGGMKTGIYMGSSMSNAPNNSANWFFVLHMVHNAKYQRQVAFDFFSINIFTRRMDNGTWGAWEQVH